MKLCRRVMGVVHFAVALIAAVIYIRAFWKPVNSMAFILLFCLLFLLHVPGMFLLNPPGQRRFFGTFGLNPRAPKSANRVTTGLLLFFGINFVVLVLLMRPGSDTEEQWRHKTLPHTHPYLSHQINCAETRAGASAMMMIGTAVGLTYWFYDYSKKGQHGSLVTRA